MAREVPPPLALRQLHENVRASRVRAESLDQPGEAIAPGPAAALAVDANDIKGNSPSEREPIRRGVTRVLRLQQLACGYSQRQMRSTRLLILPPEQDICRPQGC